MVDNRQTQIMSLYGQADAQALGSNESHKGCSSAIAHGILRFQLAFINELVDEIGHGCRRQSRGFCQFDLRHCTEFMNAFKQIGTVCLA